MRYADKQGENFCVAWLEDGKSFVIRNPEEFTRKVVPKFFKATKFSSFTRKLYRWGFRQINRGIGPDDPIIFGNEFFHRDDEKLMAQMRSVTAAGTRKAEQHQMLGAMKRPLEDHMGDGSQKRILFDHLLQQKAANMMTQNSSLYGGMSTNGSLPLTNALRPTAGLPVGSGSAPTNMMPMNAPNGLKPYDFMSNSNPHGTGIMNHQYMPSNNMNNSQFPNAQSTAEIVNAAIAALRYAN